MDPRRIQSSRSRIPLLGETFSFFLGRSGMSWAGWRRLSSVICDFWYSSITLFSTRPCWSHAAFPSMQPFHSGPAAGADLYLCSYIRPSAVNDWYIGCSLGRVIVKLPVCHTALLGPRCSQTGWRLSTRASGKSLICKILRAVLVLERPRGAGDYTRTGLYAWR